MYRRLTFFCFLFLLLQDQPPAQSPALYFDKLTVQRGLSHNTVNCILRDQRGFMWFGTDDGLNRYDGHDFTIFQHRPGDSTSISGNIITSILEDEQGTILALASGGHDTLWVGQDGGGILRVNTRTLQHMTNPAFGDPYAGSNYFIPFAPLAVQEPLCPPQIQFTDFKIFNESHHELLQDSCIRLNYWQNYFTVMFASPDVLLGHTTRYQYQLVGRDESWIDIGSRNILEFSNLEARDYLLKIRATNHAGRWSNQSAQLAISIVPPFWQRWWFYTICGCSIGIIFYFVYRYRIDQLLEQQIIRNKIAQDLHDHVGSTLSSISVYSQVAKIYHEQSRRSELQLTLEKISATSVEMISEMNDIVWTINPRHDSMDTILLRMESFARPLLASQGIHFHFEVEPAVKMVNLEMSRRKNFYLIYKEAVNNALKYAQCKNLWVKIGLRHHQLHLVAVDDGIGFDIQQAQVCAAQSLSGNGLRNMEMRAEEMRGLWQIESLAGRGTTVHLRFPVA